METDELWIALQNSYSSIFISPTFTSNTGFYIHSNGHLTSFFSSLSSSIYLRSALFDERIWLLCRSRIAHRSILLNGLDNQADSLERKTKWEGNLYRNHGALLRLEGERLVHFVRSLIDEERALLKKASMFLMNRKKTISFYSCFVRDLGRRMLTLSSFFFIRLISGLSFAFLLNPLSTSTSCGLSVPICFRFWWNVCFLRE